MWCMKNYVKLRFSVIYKSVHQGTKSSQVNTIKIGENIPIHRNTLLNETKDT